MKSHRGRYQLTVLAVLGSLLYACNGSTEKPQSPPLQSATTTPAVPLNISLNAVMVGLVDHASHSIWNAPVAGKAPKNDKEWGELEHHAIQIAAAGSLISMPGTGKSDEAWVKNPEWQKYARELSDTGLAAWDAAKKKDIKAISEAGDKLVSTCEGCHKAYKGELPTEGILHPHYEQ